jgi:hypothetical protein
MYYVLDCDYPRDEAGGYLDIDDGIEIDGIENWSTGHRFTVPIESVIEVNVIPEGGYRGPPKEMKDANLLLMSDRLVSALRAAGVDNIDVYRALLRNVATGETYAYQAVNIIGVIAAADLARSEWASYDGEPLFDTSFESLALNENALAGALLCRLAENTGTILIHEKVRDRILASGIDTLNFIEPEDWMQL